MGEEIKRYKFLDLGEVNGPLLPEISAAVNRVVGGGRYVGGPENESFERELAQSVGADYAVGVSNGLDALRLILRAYMEEGFLQSGDEVIVPSNTYIATILAILDNGLKPVLVEPRIDTLNLDSERIEAAVTERTRVIMTVHLYGRVAYDERMQSVADKYGLRIVEDNAQAIGARYADGRMTGTLGHAAAFSFYPTKNIGAMGDAGAVTTGDVATAARVRALANYGTDRTYHNIYKGLNCRLDPIQAAILRVKLPGLEEESERRRRLADVYLKEISNPEIRLPKSGKGNMVWHQFVVMTPEREQFREFLSKNGVETAVHYPTAPHRQPCMKEYEHLPLPLAEQIAAEVVSLPVSACTSETDAREIAGIINKFSTQSKR